MGAVEDLAAKSAAQLSLSALVEAFLHELTALRRLSAHTRAAYAHDLARLDALARADGTELQQLSPASIRRYAAKLHAAGRAPSSIARTLSAWRSFYRWLGMRGGASSNPASGVRAPRRPARLPKALAPDEALALAAHATDGSPVALRDRAIVELLYSSGLRLSELVALDWRYFSPTAAQPRSRGWIDLAGGEATVTGKGNKQRSVPVGAPALEALRSWLAVRAQMLRPRARDDERALFLSARGRRMSGRSVQVRVAAVAARLGLPQHVHPHMLRHSMASHVLQSSGDLRAVQELLGHASIAATQIYTRLDWQHLAKAYDAAHPRARSRESARRGKP
ncbi:MAG TPA: tyrosine recombinase XerC [Burkholderiaceae bacterium]|nr:tyrosine recombinase XerC [Burkholderiaceae bacterium]